MTPRGYIYFYLILRPFLFIVLDTGATLMNGSESKMKDFMEGNDKRFIIPVYQRKYDWKYENCKQLYEDLKKIITDNRESHFFGSIVLAVVPNGSKIEYHIIDGQQRLTTITLLLLALSNLIEEGKITCT